MTAYQYDYLLWLTAKRDFPELDHRWQEPDWRRFKFRVVFFVETREIAQQQRDEIAREFERGQ